MRVVLFGVLCLLAGCGYQPTVAIEEPPRPSPIFKGEPAATRINFDLAGTWEVMRFGTKEKQQKGERWEAKWVLRWRDVGRLHKELWDENGQGHFWLSAPTVDDKSGRVADMLVWARSDGTKWYLSVNEQKFGYLEMTGDDDELYMAIRTEGGERAKPRSQRPTRSLDAPEQLAPLPPIPSRPRLIVDGFTIEERCDKKWYEIETGERVMFMEWTTTDGVVHRRLMPSGGGEVEKRLKAVKQRQAVPPPPAPVGYPSIEHPR